MSGERRETNRGGSRSSRRCRERELATLAGNRHRVVSLDELVRIGFTRREIQRRLESGRLVRVYRRRRERALLVAGWTTVRILDDDVDEEVALPADLNALLRDP